MWSNITKISALLTVLKENNTNTYTIWVLISLLVCTIGLFAVFYYANHLEGSQLDAGICFSMLIDRYESPINIDTNKTRVLNMHKPLIWNGYQALPASITMENTGDTVIIKASCYSNLWPHISGADMMDRYFFESMSFRWGISDAAGSEHTINKRSFPLELQVIHVMRKEKLRYLIICYLYRITNCDNPYIDPVIMNLPRITQACTVPVNIDPFPLAWLVPPIRTGFFSYGGSMTSEPYDTGVSWFIHSEPLAISRSQMEQFRNVQNRLGQRFGSYRRPIQPLNQRVVCYNQYQPIFTSN